MIAVQCWSKKGDDIFSVLSYVLSYPTFDCRKGYSLHTAFGLRVVRSSRARLKSFQKRFHSNPKQITPLKEAAS